MECLHGLINAVNRLPVVVLTAVLCVSCSKDTPDSPGEGYGMQPLNVDFRIAVPVDASATDGAEYDGNGTWETATIRKMPCLPKTASIGTPFP